MTNVDLLCQRLNNQHLAHASLETAEDVVRWFGAIQAQDFLYALWAVGLRMARATEADIEQALAERAIVRTWPMRSTIHFVPAEDAAWMIKLLSQRVIHSLQSVYRRAGLDETIFTKSRKVLAKALQGKQLTRKELYAALEQAEIEATYNTAVGSRGTHIVRQLAMEGLLCFGPRRGRQPTFVLLDEWAPHPRRLEGDEALAELASRYFRSHGPATEYDFAWWAGLTITDARLAIELVKPQLERETINDQTYWWFGRSLPTAAKPASTTYLLPYLDEYTVAYKDRSALIEPEDEKKLNASHPVGILGPVIVIGGQVVGTWKRTLKKEKVIIETNLVRPLNATEETAVTVAAERFGNFVGLPVEW